MENIKTFQGTSINLKAYQHSLNEYASFARKGIDNQGVPYLTNCAFNSPKCGCEIIGNGTLQFPLSIKYCKKHKH